MTGTPDCPATIQRCGAREYLEALIAHERKLREAAAEDTARALRIQANEYERRLDILNNEHGRLDAAQRQFVNRELFGEFRDGLARELEIDRVWKKEVRTLIDEWRGASAAQMSRQQREMAIVVIILTIISLIIKFIPI